MCCLFFPRDILDEIWDLIESASEDFSYITPGKLPQIPPAEVLIIGCCCCVVLCFVVLLFYVHGKHLRSCRDGQLT